MARTLTGRQSKAARALLKWNLSDIASRCRVTQRRIQSFESAQVHLQAWEMSMLYDTYKDAGCLFMGDLSVVLRQSSDAPRVGYGQTIAVKDEDFAPVIRDEEESELTEKERQKLEESRRR